MTIFETVMGVIGIVIALGVILLSMYDNECRMAEEREIRELLLSELEYEEES